ncbi:MAG: hypothetical protein M1820_006773 [Bogoriella megaspora]|nr:MAG: hypothetical protein M1820_006773 [Bogoriella megaspora]
MSASSLSPQVGVPPATSAATTTAGPDGLRRSLTSPSCQLCRKRKVRCDKNTPCLSCQRAGVECIYAPPARLPRGRQGGRRKKDTELLNRIAKLENLIKNIENDDVNNSKTTVGTRKASTKSVDTSHFGSSASPGSPSQHDDSRSQGSSSNTSGEPPFWISVSDEINGLRYLLGNQTLDDSDEEDENIDETQESIPDPATLTEVPHDNQSWLFCGPNGLSIAPGAMQFPPRAQIIELCEVFLTNVNTFCNILHGPSLRRYLHGQSSTLDGSPGEKGLTALKFSILHSATASLTEQDCVSRLGADRKLLLANLRRSTEIALAAADLMNSLDISTLQALILFIREMRKRLWWTICWVDSGLSMDRGSSPVVLNGTHNTPRPLHIRDDDIWLEGPEEVPERDEFTDMTFSLICQECYTIFQELNYFVGGRNRDHAELPDQWEQRKALVTSCQERIQRRYLRHCDFSNPIHWLVKMVTNVQIASLWLTVYRPWVQDSVPIPPYENPNILALAVEVLEKYGMFQFNPKATSVEWLSRNYVQWHPLAIVLAELCVHFEGPLVERAWKCVERHYDTVAQGIADSNRGMRWQPIRKLMIKARKARQNHHQSRGDTTQAPPTGALDFEYLGMPLEFTATLSNFAPSELQQSMQSVAASPITTAQPARQEMFDWDPWLATSAATSMPATSNTNQSNLQNGWTSWENFVDDFQGEGYIQDSDASQFFGWQG